MQVDGSSHVVHSEEEALGTRLTIDSKTCLLSNEHDPSKVRTLTARLPARPPARPPASALDSLQAVGCHRGWQDGSSQPEVTRHGVLSKDHPQ